MSPQLLVGTLIAMDKSYVRTLVECAPKEPHTCFVQFPSLLQAPCTMVQTISAPC